MDQNFQKLIDSRVSFFGRTLDMFRIGFDKEGEEYCLHIQTYLRFRTKNKLLINGYDINLDQEGNQYDGWLNSFDSLFDKEVISFQSLYLNKKVEKIEIKPFFDINIYLENGYVFDIFNNINTKREIWRFFKRGDIKSHLISWIGKDRTMEYEK